MDDDYSVELFMNIERTMWDLYNAGRVPRGETHLCGKSWEQFEAEGYRIVTVRIVEFQCAPNTANTH